MEYTYQLRGNYDTSLIWNDEKIKCFSKKKFWQLYPEHCGGFRVIGCIGKADSKNIGTWSFGNSEFPYYSVSSHNCFYKISGYIAVGENEYLLIFKRIFWKRIIQYLLCLILICVIGYICFNWLQDTPDIDPLSSKYHNTLKLDENIDPSKITIPGYGDIKMKAGTDIAYVALYNPDKNPCYFQFTILEDATGQIIYKSKLVPPSNAITQVKLNKIMKIGIHPITIRITSFDLSNSKVEKNGGEVKAQIIGME